MNPIRTITHILEPSVLAAGCCAVLTLLAAAPSMAAGAAVDCIVQCAKGSCVVKSGDKQRALELNKPVQLPACQEAVMSSNESTLYGLFQTPKGPERFTVRGTDVGRSFSALVPALARATCAVGNICIEERTLSRIAGTGGKGADEDKVAHDGKPCETGLPCGQILRPKQNLSIELPGVTSGKFTLTPKRGAGSAAVLDVRDGRLELTPAALQPGVVYRYALEGGAGTPPVRGEFGVMSSRMQADIEKAIADAARKEPEGATFAEVEILLEEKLQWDATRKTR